MFIDVIQNTEKWENLRVGKVTSSNFAKIMANDGKAFGNPAIEYAQKIALEVQTGTKDVTESFKNSYMERGNELEPIAIMKYEEQNFIEVNNGGFYILESTINNLIQIGDSPDGNIGEKGSCEVKTVIPNTQWKRIKSKKFDSAYKWQIQGHIWVGQKEWCDFISYCPEMVENKQLFIQRIYRDEEMIKSMEKRIAKDFIEEIHKNIEILKAA